jgi:hypothetical protein
VQYLRGDIPVDDDGQATNYSFYQIYNSFISIYVVCTFVFEREQLQVLTQDAGILLGRMDYNLV